jgi:hypothetical protein
MMPHPEQNVRAGSGMQPQRRQRFPESMSLYHTVVDFATVFSDVHVDLGRLYVTDALIFDVRDELEQLHPEVDWDAVAATPSGDVTRRDVSDALLEAGCDPLQVATFTLDD